MTSLMLFTQTIPLGDVAQSRQLSENADVVGRAAVSQCCQTAPHHALNPRRERASFHRGVGQGDKGRCLEVPRTNLEYFCDILCFILKIK